MIPHHHAPMKQLHRSNEGWIEGLDGVPISKMTHRRQDLETTYGLNGLIWACRSKLLFQDPPALWGEKDLGMITDDLYNIDLDHPADWEIGEVRMRAILEEKKNNEV